ncbi:hypothetical protein BO71DRAFT_37162 [Aspergillus ellipticus CBS 707.79]|uniref:Aminoglycoside phosphotransferase domain-containing protein n=1 Tax=Aspergillus ellipticus CBS 707.79 TaxID=1448320 RepID=A0A319DCA2_9EURO|nr:hypothetical protein BO71DRAFT_37162 [Aspergillus ellipticus CBS 707.79]
MQRRMCFDDVAWEKSDEISDTWVLQFLDHDLLRPLGGFVWRYHEPDDVTEFGALSKGFFNICVRMKYKDDSSSMIRFSQPGVTMFPEEKVRNEVAMMRYIKDQTAISLPFIFHWGTEGPLELGPFILMDYIDHDMDMGDALETPGRVRGEPQILDPNIDEGKLQMLYGQLAGVLLQLSKLAFPRIGSLSQFDDFTWEVTRRPLSASMNELVRVGTLPQSQLPNENSTFDTASSYFEALAELHMKHLVYQRNDAVDSAADCRRKFIARRLFQKLAKDNKLTTPSLKHRPFSIWCDDFRPSNVLIKDHQIAGVLDWEFTYAAPAEFSCAPPWWLLIEKPEYWPEGLGDWTNTFEERLQIFLRAMAECEDTAINGGRLTEEQRLSGPMRQSWESGDFWIAYAARQSFAFDEIYWQKIDPRFFGPTDSTETAWKHRLNLLDEKERDEMERLVALKLGQMQDRVLAWDPDERTKSLQGSAESDRGTETTHAAQSEGETDGVDEVTQSLQAQSIQDEVDIHGAGETRSTQDEGRVEGETLPEWI